MELQGEGFTLRQIRLTDAASLQKHADNPKVSAFLMDRFPSPYTLADAEFWVNLMQHKQPLTHFAIAINNEVCGGIAIELMNDVNRITGEIGYWLAEQYWGQGIITQAVNLVTGYAFKNLSVLRIQAGVYHKNTASMRVLEKAGYTKEGVLRNAVIKNGVVMDKHVYAILKEEYQQGI
ncbi:GNAT family N-acetyltransferase [Mucilaginibacter sp. FT3.2]|uniref:GNAT family N-acetyltransferase n=1 Tax=Mucilaginibacter sp. FT3.2 TaxID=2723090 RepID=UPI00161CCCFF|nr:GNAT family protein [Mucilaginibacter sp. FT3.2]MBB6232614.1 RimJ/RimL family protein N-acetyltransferase [Mucilaginibacter sp. FT3.2]